MRHCHPLFFGLLLGCLAGCPDSAGSPRATSPSNPSTAPSYPQAPTVPVDELAKVLPEDEQGNKVLWSMGKTKVVLGPPPIPGPNTSSAACLQLKTSCLVASSSPKESVLDECVDGLPRCETNEPWTEAQPCCPSSCVDAYKEERRLGASQLEASSAVFGSNHECFPGLRDWYREKGDPNPYLAPRRAALPEEAR